MIHTTLPFVSFHINDMLKDRKHQDFVTDPLKRKQFFFFFFGLVAFSILEDSNLLNFVSEVCVHKAADKCFTSNSLKPSKHGEVLKNIRKTQVNENCWEEKFTCYR